MIIKENFLQKLRQAFNLNIYEVKIWTALLSRGISTAGELSDISEVPRSRSYDVLETLEKKGFVMAKLGKPIKYIAIKPEEVIRRVKKGVKEHTDSKLEQLEKVKKTGLFTDLKLLHTQGIKFIEPSDLSGAVKGRDNVYNQFNTILTDAKKKVVIVTSSDGLVRKYNSLKRVLKKLNDKGVEINIVAPITSENKTVVENLMEFANVRNTRKIDARFVIVDGKEVMFMVLSDKDVHPSYDVGVWVKTPFFASALDDLFNVVWNKLEDGKEVVSKLK